MNNYIEIDFSKVTGYNNLTQFRKIMFSDIYKKHNSSLGTQEKEKWIPIKVENCYHSGFCFRVIFANGEWLHYYCDCTWG